MKLVKKIVPVALSLTLCASMVAPAFAAVALDKDVHIASTGELLSHEETNEAGETVQSYDYYLESDIVLDKTLSVKGVEASIDLNGYTLALNDGMEVVGDPDGDGTVVVKVDGEVKVDGGKVSSYPDKRGAVIAVRDGATLTVTGGERTDEDTGETVTGTITGGFMTDSGSDKWKLQGGGVSVVEGSTFIMSGGEISNNYTYTGHRGGGVYASNATVVLDGTTITSNGSTSHGGGVYGINSDVTISNALIEGNFSNNEGGGVSVYADEGETASLTITGSTIQNNTGLYQGGVKVYGYGTVKLEMDDTQVLNNKATVGAGGIDLGTGGGGSIPGASSASISNSLITGNQGAYTVYGGCGGVNLGNLAIDDVFESSIVCGNTENGEKSDTSEGVSVHQNYDDVDWVVTIPAQPGVPGLESKYCPRCGELLATRPIPALPVPATPETGSAGSGEAEVEIDEVDVPLAGLFTRADAIGYLWQQAGEPEWELSDFEDVPEDHQWAVAIGWAQDMGIAVADLEGNFRPDDLVLRSVEDIELSPEGELQEFLNRYAVYAGIELDADGLFIELAGDWDDIIMGEDAQVIFDDFFAKLEAALSAAA